MRSRLDETALARLEARLAEVERANACLSEELAALRSLARGEELARGGARSADGDLPQQSAPPALLQAKASRQGLLRRILGAAAATAAAGTLIQSRAGAVLAANNASFGSNSPGIPGVFVYTTNGAEGIQVTSDGTGVDVQSSSGVGISAVSHNLDGIKAISTDGNGITASTQNGTAVDATSSSGDGVDATSITGDGIKAISTDGNGISASTTNGTAVVATSQTGVGVSASSEGYAGVGLQVAGRVVLTANSAGTKAFGQAAMPAGQWHVEVQNAAATPQSIILLMPTSNPNARLWVTSATGAFAIYASYPPAASVTINYLIVN
jgi:hypothetical protein